MVKKFLLKERNYLVIKAKAVRIVKEVMRNRQHCRLSICFHFDWVWQILRRLRWASESGCKIFDGPQLSEKCLKVAVFGGLAVPYIWNHYWVGFWGHIYITEELGGAFLSHSPTPVVPILGNQYFFSFCKNWICFENQNSYFSHPWAVSNLQPTHPLTLFRDNCSSKSELLTGLAFLLQNYNICLQNRCRFHTRSGRVSAVFVEVE